MAELRDILKSGDIGEITVANNITYSLAESADEGMTSVMGNSSRLILRQIPYNTKEWYDEDITDIPLTANVESPVILSGVIDEDILEGQGTLLGEFVFEIVNPNTIPEITVKITIAGIARLTTTRIASLQSVAFGARLPQVLNGQSVEATVISTEDIIIRGTVLPTSGRIIKYYSTQDVISGNFPAFDSNTYTDAEKAKVTAANNAIHNPVTLATDGVTEEAATLVAQQLALKKATISTDGVMSSEDKANINNIVSVTNFWVSGLLVYETDPKTQSVFFDAGSYVINAVLKTIGVPGIINFTSLYTGMTSEQRKLCILYVDNDQAVKVLAGTAYNKDANPITPSLPSPSVCIAIVELRVDKSANPKVIENKNIFDCRTNNSYRSDEFVKVSSDDTVSSYLFDKLSNNGSVTFTIENVGGNEKIKADAAGGSTRAYGELCRITTGSLKLETTPQKLQFDGAGVSNAGVTLSTVDSRITALVAGDYLVEYSGSAFVKRNELYTINVRKNGVLVGPMGNYYNTIDNTQEPFSYSKIVSCAANDYIEIWGTCTGTKEWYQDIGTCFRIQKLN